MNPIVVIHLLASVLVISLSVPLIRRKVKMNHWYGVRIPASFVSDEAWYDINHYGGRLLFYWGLAIAGTAGFGAFLKEQNWIIYNWTALVVILGGLALVVANIYRYAQKNHGA